MNCTKQRLWMCKHDVSSSTFCTRSPSTLLRLLLLQPLSALPLPPPPPLLLQVHLRLNVTESRSMEQPHLQRQVQLSLLPRPSVHGMLRLTSPSLLLPQPRLLTHLSPPLPQPRLLTHLPPPLPLSQLLRPLR